MPHGARPAQTALRWLGRRASGVELTYRDLAGASRASPTSSTASASPAAIASSRSPRGASELYVAALGALKHRVCSARFSRPSVPSRCASEWRSAALARS